MLIKSMTPTPVTRSPIFEIAIAWTALSHFSSRMDSVNIPAAINVSSATTYHVRGFFCSTLRISTVRPTVTNDQIKIAMNKYSFFMFPPKVSVNRPRGSV